MEIPFPLFIINDKMIYDNKINFDTSFSCFFHHVYFSSPWSFHIPSPALLSPLPSPQRPIIWKMHIHVWAISVFAQFQWSNDMCQKNKIFVEKTISWLIIWTFGENSEIKFVFRTEEFYLWRNFLHCKFVKKTKVIHTCIE